MQIAHRVKQVQYVEPQEDRIIPFVIIAVTVQLRIEKRLAVSKQINLKNLFSKYVTFPQRLFIFIYIFIYLFIQSSPKNVYTL